MRKWAVKTGAARGFLPQSYELYPELATTPVSGCRVVKKS